MTKIINFKESLYGHSIFFLPDPTKLYKEKRRESRLNCFPSYFCKDSNQTNHGHTNYDPISSLHHLRHYGNSQKK